MSFGLVPQPLALLSRLAALCEAHAAEMGEPRVLAVRFAFLRIECARAGLGSRAKGSHARTRGSTEKVAGRWERSGRPERTLLIASELGGVLWVPDSRHAAAMRVEGLQLPTSSPSYISCARSEGTASCYPMNSVREPTHVTTA